MAIGGQARGQVVGALACQRNAYLRTLETAVVSCEKAPERKQKQPPSAGGGKAGKGEHRVPSAGDGEAERWLVEFEDSVLFPEGGGQPSDHGTITLQSDADATPIPVTFVERIGLRCVCHSPRPLEPGDRVLQEVDFQRRWDHMQQHTGQHLLSAVLGSSSNLGTVGWGMGSNGALNYVDLDRKPSQDQLEIVLARCTELIRRSLPITVESPQDARLDKIPDDYDQSKGCVRVICIGDIDRNTCCGTHLSSTAHISLILTHHGETVHGTNFRLYFSAGDKAIRLATSSVGTVGSIARLLQCRNSPEDVMQTVKSTRDTAADLRKRERKLLADIADLEAEAAMGKLQRGRVVWVHRADGTPDFVKALLAKMKGVLSQRPGAVVVATGEERQSGQITVLGEKQLVDALVVNSIKKLVPGVKGGGVGDKWQGKVPEWEKGALKALETAVGSALG
ncbi:uncharacterized protein E0L32_000928 [Thyridium curvatum]|uniref:Threonyl/alanyl tRNA synthetase SAD domain-containing protein n=1 Tax=Thyridium curvatum TaxID=1093900 RepID=A0A507B6T5_9PEZI|nr:uncharacterized protein E0L32_000928 [Thyridium curvatum]TPX12751.1 hypothetical protein E0L32_000928 [Thyridium curvatum]